MSDTDSEILAAYARPRVRTEQANSNSGPNGNRGYIRCGVRPARKPGLGGPMPIYMSYGSNKGDVGRAGKGQVHGMSLGLKP